MKRRVCEHAWLRFAQPGMLSFLTIARFCDIIAISQLLILCKNQESTQINRDDRETIAQNIRQFRRATMRDFIFNILHAFGDFDFSLPQLATLMLLDEEGGLTIKQVAELLGRSTSVTSRLLDQLVERGLVSRREDERDRRAKRVAITESGRTLILTLERRRAEAQVTVIEHLSPEEQADVARAMALLAAAGKRSRSYEHSESRTTTAGQHSDE